MNISPAAFYVIKPTCISRFFTEVSSNYCK